MTRDEMITAFRVYGQQMGMQKMRNILDKEIDVFLNSAVIEKIRQVLGTNVNAQFADKVSIQQNSISPINYVRTLIKEESLITNTPSDIQIMYILGVEVGGYKCRFVEPTEWNNTINDFCNAPSKEYPICTFISDKFKINDGEDVTLSNTLEATLTYVENPNKIGENSDCNLPDYTHDEIVQLAVQKYFVSLNNTQKVN